MKSIAIPRMHHAYNWFNRLDPRWFQILFLSSFLVLGALGRDFAIGTLQVAGCFASGLLTQAAWQHGLRLPGRRTWGAYLSAIISCFGICILVRSQNLWVHPLLACLAMSSKYLLRAGPQDCRSHIFNPANFAAYAAWAWVGGAWLSPGQWGSDCMAALWFVALGGLVTQRIARWDVSLTFLVAWGTLLAGRLLWFDYAWNPGAAMWLQQMSNGAVLLFAFFMISDPMTTPQHRIVRLAYACIVAIFAFVWQYALYKPHGLIVALFVCSLTVPVLNYFWPKVKFSWRFARTL
jgi:hypothetical protein